MWAVGCGTLPLFFFFFRQKTAYEIRPRDWSSVVCSSDLCRSWPESGAGPQLRIPARPLRGYDPKSPPPTPPRGSCRRRSRAVDTPRFPSCDHALLRYAQSMTRARDLSLAIAIVVWATLLGGIVYSHVVWFPPYLSDLPKTAALAQTIHDKHFWLALHPPALLSLIAALALNWKLRARRKLIATTMAIYAVAIITTALYFVPELIAFRDSASSNVAPAEW